MNYASITNWYTDKSSDEGVIISSRVRLARNLQQHPFPRRINERGARAVLEDVRKAADTQNRFRFTDLTGIPPERLIPMAERHMISAEMAQKQAIKGFLYSVEETVSIMLNEEDHIRIQSVFPGDDIDRAFAMADGIDDMLEERLEYAFDPEFGYLTSCPTNAGTGMRASYMLHLPALERTDKLKEIIKVVTKFGMTVRGTGGEGSDPEGSIYQISNQTTLGKSEQEMIAALKTVVGQVVDHEQTVAQTFMDSARNFTEDSIYRAYGILTNARLLKAGETMELLSSVRAGYNWGILREPRPKLTIYHMMLECRPGNTRMRVALNMEADKAKERDMDAARAAFVREQFLNGASPQTPTFRAE